MLSNILINRLHILPFTSGDKTTKKKKLTFLAEMANLGYIIDNPEKYKEEFGFPPNVYGVAPDVGVHRFPIQTPVKSLFLVGDSVAPEGPCVPQAMESGLDCARVIAAKFGVDLPTE